MITNFIIQYENENRNNNFPQFKQDLKNEISSQMKQIGATLTNWTDLSGFITRDDKCVYFAYVSDQIDISSTRCVIIRNANSTIDYNSANNQYTTLKDALEKIIQMLNVF